jgi:Tfp pilus assembly protein PilP
MTRAWIWLAIGLAACGGDDDDDAPKGPPKPAAPAAPVRAGGLGGGILPQVHVEQRVPPGERATIRRPFLPCDFIVGSCRKVVNRDPFQSFTIIQPGMASATQETKAEVTPICTDPKQMIATNYSYGDLKLVGIVTVGTQRKVLMTDAAKGGYIIKRGDCVGKEKAVVKDIGIANVTFEVQADAAGTRGEERSIQLYPNQLQMSPDDVPTGARPTTIAPVQSPPPSLPPNVPMPGPSGSMPPPAGAPPAPPAGASPPKIERPHT